MGGDLAKVGKPDTVTEGNASIEAKLLCLTSILLIILRPLLPAIKSATEVDQPITIMPCYRLPVALSPKSPTC
jgi:hypothetical protein